MCQLYPVQLELQSLFTFLRFFLSGSAGSVRLRFGRISLVNVDADRIKT